MYKFVGDIGDSSPTVKSIELLGYDIMKKILTRRPPLQPLADGQVWRMAEMILQVKMVGKLLVHYKLGKPNAIRIPNSLNNIKTVEKYLKVNKAVLV
jgi:hypothetical protein